MSPTVKTHGPNVAYPTLAAIVQKCAPPNEVKADLDMIWAMCPDYAEQQEVILLLTLTRRSGAPTGSNDSPARTTAAAC